MLSSFILRLNPLARSGSSGAYYLSRIDTETPEAALDGKTWIGLRYYWVRDGR